MIDVFRSALAALAATSLIFAGVTAPAKAERVVGVINWGIWIDNDGCQHYWADGGLEGYMVPRLNPATGHGVCYQKKICLSLPVAEAFGSKDDLRPGIETFLRGFFDATGAAGYAATVVIADPSPSVQHIRLSQRRHEAVGAMIGRVGERPQNGSIPPVAQSSATSGDVLQISCFY
jgi:hypothetical protein